MYEYIALVIFLATAYVFYRYYLYPKSQIKRYRGILQKLGYSIYEQPFSFFGLSFSDDFERGVKLHKDAEYYERVVYSQVDVSLGNVFDKPIIALVNPDLIKEFTMVSISGIYPKDELLVTGIRNVMGNGIMLNQGEEWKNKRKLLSKLFSFDLIVENIPKICQLCDQSFDKFDAENKIGENTYKYVLAKATVRINNGIMMACFFGSGQINEEIMGEKYEEFFVKTITKAAKINLDAFHALLGKFGWKYGLTSDIRDIKERNRRMKEVAGQIFKKRMEEVKNSPITQKPTDILQALVYEKMKNQAEFQYTDNSLFDEFQTFMAAGTDPSTHFFTMIAYYMGKYPQVHQKVREQVNSIIKTNEDITFENLKKLTYIDWVQLETTRFYGPTNGLFWRKATEDNMILNIPIKKGTLLSTQPKGNHFSTKYFKDPEVFRPERWESQCDNLHPYVHIGFSAGPRNCLGKQLAHLQSKIQLVKLIKRYKTIEVPQEQLTMNYAFLYQIEHFETTFTK